MAPRGTTRTTTNRGYEPHARASAVTSPPPCVIGIEERFQWEPICRVPATIHPEQRSAFFGGERVLKRKARLE